MRSQHGLPVLLLLFVTGPLCAEGLVWDLNTDALNARRSGPAAPSFGSWSYGFGTEAAFKNAYGFEPAIASTNPGAAPYKLFVEKEKHRGTSPFGAIYLNDSGSVDCCDVKPNEHGLVLGRNIHAPKVRWTAPADMDVRIHGVFTSGNASRVLVSVIRNDAEILFDGASLDRRQDQPFNVEVTVESGDTIDFALREAANFGESHTGLSVTIQQQVAPRAVESRGDATALRTREVVSLDGLWTIVTDPENVGRDQQWWQQPWRGAKPVRVPGIIQDAFPRYHGVVWYRRRFNAPEKMGNDDRCLLRFWAVSYLADVWVNGVHIGNHEGADTPFVLDATDALRFGERNTVVVRVLDPGPEPIDGFVRGQVPGGNVFPHGGFEDSVDLLVVPSVYLEDVFVRANPGTGDVVVQATVRNTLATISTVEFEFVVAPTSSGETQAGRAFRKTIAPGSTTVDAALRVENPRLWDLKEPWLYRLATRVRLENDLALDEKSTRFGFRDFRVENGYFRLNGRRVFLRSSHTGNECPIGVRVPHDPDFLRRDLINCKAMGFNAIRFFQALGLRYQLDLCDEIGLMAIQEPRGGWLYDYSARANDRYTRSVREMILRDRNHPSIVTWGLLNEHPWATGDSALFRHTVGLLPMIRSLDDSRLVLLSSGRWDAQPGIGSVSNPGSSEWQCLLGIDEPGADPITPLCDRGGPPRSAPGASPIAGYVGPLGDIHVYPQVPHMAETIEFLRTVGKGTKNVFVSEYGIASAVDLLRLARHYEQRNAEGSDFGQDYLRRLGRFLVDWKAWSMAECFGRPEDYFARCLDTMAGQRLMSLNALRANPWVNGYSLTGTVDQGKTGEGVVTQFREFKPGTIEALYDGFAPLRWCLFAEPAHVYRGAKVRLEAVLANEDILPAGNYPVRFEIFDRDAKRVFVRSEDVTVPGLADNGEEVPFATQLFSEEVSADWPTGKYRFVATFEHGAAAAGREAVFYITDAADMPEVHEEVVLWGDDPGLVVWLESEGIRVGAFDGAGQSARELILASHEPPAPGGQRAFVELMEHVARGSNVVFLDPGIFAGDTGKDPARWVPLQKKGNAIDRMLTSFVYPKDTWAKRHPIFAGLQAGGVLDTTYYRELFSQVLHEGQDRPDECVAAAIVTSWKYFSGTRVAVHKFGKGRFILNSFRIRENLGTHPVAERLLRNMLNYMSLGDLDPASLPEDFEKQLGRIGYRS